MEREIKICHEVPDSDKVLHGCFIPNANGVCFPCRAHPSAGSVSKPWSVWEQERGTD